MLEAKLIVVGGDIGCAEIPLKLPAVIGRSRDATLTLPHPLVSRQHCELFERNGRLMVRDLGSRNGTYIANEKISEAPLPSGELLTIGAVTFRAVYDGSAATRSAEPGTTEPAEGLTARRPFQVSDSVVPLSESELFRPEDLSDDAFGVDSGHFDDGSDESTRA